MTSYLGYHPSAGLNSGNTRIIDELKVAITIVKLIGERKSVVRPILLSQLSQDATTTILSSTNSSRDKNMTIANTQYKQ